MARSDLIVELVKAGVRGDLAKARSAAEAIAADEAQKKHTGVASRITRILDASSTPNGNGNQKSEHRGIRVRDGSGGVLQREARRPISELFLTDSVSAACDELIEEQRRADLLRAHGLEPRHRVLLVGPPGNGKTSLAECLAYELALPLFTVRYDAIVTSYLGETAQRLRRLFDFVRTQPCVLFFDEFDAIGKERGDIHETGEIKRVVTTLLLQVDDLPSYCVVVGATNHPELLDRATWRRFELRLELGQPSNTQLEAYIQQNLNIIGEASGYTGKRLSTSIDLRSFSEAEAFILDIRRRWVLSQGGRTLRSIIDDRIRSWHERESISEDLSNYASTSNTEVD